MNTILIRPGNNIKPMSDIEAYCKMCLGLGSCVFIIQVLKFDV